MSEPDNIVLVFLRRLAKVELSIAGVNRRIDRIEERIERPLDLVETPH